jgi:hypothetical protein
VLRRTLLLLLSLITISVTPSAAAVASCTGSWTDLPIRSHHNPEGVAAITQDDAWLVAWDTGSDEQPHGSAYHWDGAAWIRVPTPNPGTGEELRGVGAIAADDVWIVGRRYLHPYTVHWDGTRLTSVPIDAGRFAELEAVDGVAADDVWAVGTHFADGEYRSVTVHWDGAEWTEVPTPQPERATSFLADVEVIASDDVWAVGLSKLPRELGRPLALHWDGVSWSRTSAGPTGSFHAVAATPRGRVWAMGAGRHGQLAERWNGSEWKVMPTPDAGRGTFFNSVSAVAGDEVWAAGSAGYRGSLFRWDGTAWQVEEVPGQPYTPLVSVDSLPTGVSFAAGTTNRDDILALRRCPAV